MDAQFCAPGILDTVRNEGTAELWGMTARGWRWDDDWRHVKLMDWLCTPVTHREPQTKVELAALLGCDARSLRLWAEHPQFREEWQRRVTKIIGSPERHKQVLDTLYAAAVDPKNRNMVQAAKLYLEVTEAIKPKALAVTVKRPTDLTDEELDALLARGADELRTERATASADASAVEPVRSAIEDDVDEGS